MYTPPEFHSCHIFFPSKSVVRAVKVSHAACQGEFRQNPRCPSCRFFSSFSTYISQLIFSRGFTIDTAAVHYTINSCLCIYPCFISDTWYSMYPLTNISRISGTYLFISSCFSSEVQLLILQLYATRYLVFINLLISYSYQVQSPTKTRRTTHSASPSA